jgi:hypothetical protein
MNNKILVKLYVPMIEKNFEVWLPINKKLSNIVKLLVKAIDEFSRGYYKPEELPFLYNKTNAKQYDLNILLKDTDIRNGTELILI